MVSVKSPLKKNLHSYEFSKAFVYVTGLIQVKKQFSQKDNLFLTSFVDGMETIKHWLDCETNRKDQTRDRCWQWLWWGRDTEQSHVIQIVQHLQTTQSVNNIMQNNRDAETDSFNESNSQPM